MLDKLITYIVCWYNTSIRSRLSHELAIATHSDTGSHNKLDLLQSFVPTHFVCNWYISTILKHSGTITDHLILIGDFLLR
jgi:hypothetical protein